MSGTYTFARTIRKEDTYDLVVAGGGPAGAATAICAGRLGARVLLAEAMGCMGGMGTCGLVNAFDPMANGKEMLVGGFMRELVEAMYARGFLNPRIDPDAWRKKYMWWTQFQGEGLKLMLDEYAAAAGVEVRFFTRVVGAEVGETAGADAARRRVDGVVLHNIEGLSFVPARTFIDATGDAVLSHLCGAACRTAGVDSPNIMPASLASTHAGIDFDRYASGSLWGQDLASVIEAEYAAGNLSQCDRHVPGLTAIGQQVGYLNAAHVFGLDATNVRSLSDGMAKGRRWVQELVRLYRKHQPGCERMELVQTGWLMGVRESRRILGEYELTVADYQNRRQFPDQIGVFNKYVDIHPYDDSNEQWNRYLTDAHDKNLGEGESFGIPYGILVPRGFDNLWTAGRCASTDVGVQGAIRVMPSSAMMGQAAGTAAVQAIQTRATADTLDTEMLVTTLRRQGAHLPQKMLTRRMTTTAANRQ